MGLKIVINKGRIREMENKMSVSMAVIALNVVIFLVVEFTGGSADLDHMISCGAVYAPLITENQEYYRLVSCMFLHFGMEHLINNMLTLYFVGGHLERAVGKVKFILIYFIGGIAGSFFSYYIEIRKGQTYVSAGASGAVFAVLGAMIYVLILNRGQLEGLAVRKMVFMAALSLYYGFASQGIDNAAHVGGFLCGGLLAVMLYHRKRRLSSQ